MTSANLNLNLAPVKSALIPSHQEETDALFPDVEVVFVLPSPFPPLCVRCSIGEALQSFIERLQNDYGSSSSDHTLRFYLERTDPSCYMMDPLSLNDFPRVRELAAQNKPIRIIVEGLRGSVENL